MGRVKYIGALLVLAWYRFWDVAEKVSGLKGLGLVIPTFAFMLVSHMFFWSTVTFMSSWTEEWYSERHPQAALEEPVCMKKISKRACLRLHEVLLVSESRTEHHYEISRKLQSYQFGFLSTAFWAGTLLAMGAVSVLSKGYDDMSPWGKGMLLGLTCAAAFFGGFPSLVSLDENIEENLSAYNSYASLSDEIRTFMRTGQTLTGEQLSGAAFIHKVDTVFSELPAPRLQFDATQVNAGRDRFIQISRELEDGFPAEAPIDAEEVVTEPVIEVPDEE